MKFEHAHAIIADYSAFTPIRSAIMEGRLDVASISNFCLSTSSKFLITSSALMGGEYQGIGQRELCAVGSPTANDACVGIDDHDHLYFTAQGTITNASTWAQGGMEIGVWNTGTDTATTTAMLPSQLNIFSSSRFYSRLSDEDVSALLAARQMLCAGQDAILFANDWPLRQQAHVEGIPLRGAAALLAALVLGELISIQRATSIYYWWKDMDAKWVPRGMSFQNVLNVQRGRLRSGVAF